VALTVLEEKGYPERAIALAEHRLKLEFDDALAGWLILQYRSRMAYAAALRLQRQRMAQQPSLANYLQLAELARILGQWEEIQPRILQWLADHQHHEVLTEIYLEEQRWREAWNTLAKTSLSEWRYRELAFAVAQESRFAMPHEAIQVFVEHARLNIEAKKRANYHKAVELLQEVRRLYLLIDDERGWLDVMSHIRGEYKRLSALQEELDKAGL
jgi:uncharacterized Zn finger protein